MRPHGRATQHNCLKVESIPLNFSFASARLCPPKPLKFPIAACTEKIKGQHTTHTTGAHLDETKLAARRPR